ncbi:MAG: outer membrane beta-barrel protein [Daejeonella sp.]
MKTRIVIVLFILTASKVYSQTKNSIALTYGMAANGLFRSARIDGAGGAEGKGATIYGIKYSKNLNNSFSIQTGLEYSFNKIETTPAPNPGIDRTPTKATIKMLSVPVYWDYTFARVLFVNAGLIVDVETNRSENKELSADNQSGIGLGFGVGGKYTFKKMSVFVNPFFQNHAVMPFKEEIQQQRLLETGVKCGIGYNF